MQFVILASWVPGIKVVPILVRGSAAALSAPYRQIWNAGYGNCTADKKTPKALPGRGVRCVRTPSGK